MINKNLIIMLCLLQGMYIVAAGEIVVHGSKPSSDISLRWGRSITQLVRLPLQLLKNFSWSPSALILLSSVKRTHRAAQQLAVKRPSKQQCADGGSRSTSVVSRTFDIQNVPVYRQGFDTSCGYHALKNGILIAQENFEQAADPLTKDILFGLLSVSAPRGGFWRQEIVAQRMQTVMLEYAKTEMRQQFFHDPAHIDPLQTLLITIGDMILKQKIQQLFDSSGAQVEVSIQDFCDAIKNFKAAPLDSQERRGAVRRLQEQPNDWLPLYMDTNARLSYTEQSWDAALQAYNTRVRSSGLNPIDQTGDGLSSGEIEALIKYEKEHGVILQDKNLNITVVEDINLVGNEELGLYDFKGIKDALDANPHYKHVFLLGTMSHSNEIGSGGMGHWFTLVVTPSAALVANSSGADSCFDERVQTILALLGKEIDPATNHVVLPITEMDKWKQNELTEEINQLIDCCSQNPAALEELQMRLISKQQECEQLSLDFGPFAQRMGKRIQGLSTNS